MNIHDIQRCFALVCATGGIVCIAAILLYAARHQLRQLFDRWLALGRLGQCVSLLMLTVFVLYGGTKPPAATNEPPDGVCGEATTNEPQDVVAGVFAGELAGVGNVGLCQEWGSGVLTACQKEDTTFHPVHLGDGKRSTESFSSSGEDTASPFSFASTPLTIASVTNWTARGAYGDWQRIDFPDGFAFPSGTNLLTGVTLFAWGELRESLRSDGALAVGPRQSATTGTSSLRIATLPSPVSLEPGASSVAYGLTASNSYLFSWQNACVNRDATNRVDASIELFRSGAILITTQPTNQPTNQLTNYLPPRPPEGFVGSGHDTNWLAAAFSPADYTAITNKGYEAWLMEDCVGINEQNGLYKATITVHSMPPNGEPCYLVCGPYKVVVTAPGAYSFPLEVFENYTARTYPRAVPLSVEYDDGYRGMDTLLGAPLPQNNAPRLMGMGLPHVLPIYLPASMYAWPDRIPLSEALGRVITIWCNLSLAARAVWHSEAGVIMLRWTPPSEAEILSVYAADRISFEKLTGKGSCSCSVEVYDDIINGCCCLDCTGEDCTCGCDCPRHSSGGGGTNQPPNLISQP